MPPVSALLPIVITLYYPAVPTKKRAKTGCPSILHQLLAHFLLTVARGNFKEAGVNDAMQTPNTASKDRCRLPIPGTENIISLIAATSDISSNIVNALDQLNWINVRCFAHALQLAVLKAAVGVLVVSKALAHCRNLVNHFN